MISTKLQGGLGNQMFQIAAAYALAKENNDICGFDFDSCYTPQQGKTASVYKQNIFKKIPEIKNYKFENFYLELGFAFNRIPYKKNLFLTGSFQSQKYFLNYSDDIKNLFYINNQKIEEYVKFLDFENSTFTSVHVRRGDYLNSRNLNFHFTCDLNYFQEAIKKIKNSKFIFFSDDMNWVKDNFVSDNYFYSPFDDELDDLSLMSLCHNNIISNSTFSWWAAFLNKNKNKKIIAPKKWFADKGHQDYQDVIPSDWITI
jgi:hypothetical protein